VLTALSAEGWRHVIVSNHVPELADVVAGLGIRAFFADVITSGLVGYEKPHPQMFEAAVRSAIPGAPIWMIGDNLECDYHPVPAFGAPRRSSSARPHPRSSATQRAYGRPRG
jgi:putative hydrolase of the HAD superfamily